ncbi:hypothetical protein CLAFUW4_12040 [Fulvia fulva]|uniref:Uncharacterized protein n=1 Tax=Passalora fulva TaxID=5499 RepID=A0A9Q8PF48_PASFU|nr:uncharacterized protein CLAFUR5_11079 [Fulvia fulva]KAK4617792.1 hypothetical protein CLAFUR4_12045 [Fulvia fulva]KAK4618830.1 hypothetical protein CLAFUR0_12056 [Fulvia fulva]UJO21351.1 hypothetical protein CLAFUR5_11079 [Fulvia fulva]WPV18461.1 hypothetical protein CLAFUW4_12040 [Fulvia fulva]WPV32918.1 hypothetical protein CLAFUW7_12047 [Fulvia fulva]
MLTPTQPQTPLLSLPRELRDIIYTFALTSFPVNFNASSTRSSLPGLLLTNRQLHAETLSLYYKLLVVTIHPYHDGHFFRWLEKLPTERVALIQDMRMTLSKEGYDRGKLMRVKDRARRHYLLKEMRATLDQRGIKLGRGVLRMEVCVGDGVEDWVWTSEPLGLKWRGGRVREVVDM